VPGVKDAGILRSRLAARPPVCLVKHGMRAVQLRHSDDAIVLRYTPGPHAALGFCINDGACAPEDLPAALSALFPPTRHLMLAPEQPTTFRNTVAADHVEVVQVDNLAGGPYLVAESGTGVRFWVGRGAQPAGDHDLAKLYLRKNQDPRIQRYGYIHGIVKPGSGCQYALGIRDNIERRRCEVEVVKTGPFVFAPRIEWKQPFDTVRLDGTDWRYYDGNVVFPPNRPGRYVVEVSTTGRPRPHLTRTCLSVDGAAWNEATHTLQLTTRRPHRWHALLPSDMPYTAQLMGVSGAVQVDGAGSMIPWSEYRAAPSGLATVRANGVMLRLRPGRTRIEIPVH